MTDPKIDDRTTLCLKENAKKDHGDHLQGIEQGNMEVPILVGSVPDRTGLVWIKS